VEEAHLPISQCIELLNQFESSEKIAHFKILFSKFQKTWKEISTLLVNLNPECSLQATRKYELEIIHLNDSTPLISLVSDDIQSPDVIIRIVSGILLRQQTLLETMDLISNYTRPNSISANWIPVDVDNQSLLLCSLDQDQVVQKFISLCDIGRGVSWFPHKQYSFQFDEIAKYLVNITKPYQSIHINNLREKFLFASKIEKIEFKSPKQTISVGEMVKEQMGMKPLASKMKLVPNGSRFSQPLSTDEFARIKATLRNLQDSELFEIRNHLISLINWISSSGNESYLIDTKRLTLNQIAEIASIKTTSLIFNYSGCFLRGICEMIIETHENKFNLFSNLPQDLDEPIGHNIKKDLEEFAKHILSSKDINKWMRSISLLMNELQKTEICNKAESQLHKPLKKIFKIKQLKDMGFDEQTLKSLFPEKVMCSNLGEYLRFLYHLSGELSLNLSVLNETRKNHYTELLPEGIEATTPVGSDIVPLPNYKELDHSVIDSMDYDTPIHEKKNEVLLSIENHEFNSFFEDKAKNLSPTPLPPPLEPTQPSIPSTRATTSTVKTSSPPIASPNTIPSMSSPTITPLASTLVNKQVIVRRLGKKRGGEELQLPATLDELLQIGGKLLAIDAVKVRRSTTESSINDINTISDKEIVFLTTKAEEEEF